MNANKNKASNAREIFFNVPTALRTVKPKTDSNARRMFASVPAALITGLVRTW